MSSDLALSIRGLSKSYTIRQTEDRPRRAGAARASRRRHLLSRADRETFVALNNVSFDVPRGEVLGVIGRNGAGKSTLLKLLSRITMPTAGEAHVFGRVGSLLEVGTGFHPELTGRENVYLNGAILGMRRADVTRRFDEIVDFAGVERFLDTPVKRYSSGMYVRLAFAVAAHLDTEILLIDEVLAVGDGAFQRKSLGKASEAASSGRTVLVVSHNVAVMSVLATSCVVLKDGELSFHGPPEPAITHYMSEIADMTQAGRFDAAQRLDFTVDRPAGRIVAGQIDSAFGIYEAGASPQLRLTVERFAPASGLCIRVTIQKVSGEFVGTAFSPAIDWPDQPGVDDYIVELPGAALNPGRYFFELELRHVDARLSEPSHDIVQQVLPFEVAPRSFGGVVEEWPPTWGSVAWRTAIVTVAPR